MDGLVWRDVRAPNGGERLGRRQLRNGEVTPTEQQIRDESPAYIRTVATRRLSTRRVATTDGRRRFTSFFRQLRRPRRGLRSGRRARSVWDGRGVAPLTPEALRQMGGDRGFLANTARQWQRCWKNGVREAASEPAWGGSRAAIPEGPVGMAGRVEAADGGWSRACQEGQLWEALAGFRSGDERAGGAEHLLGGKREL